jgi:hypothetical protein
MLKISLLVSFRAAFFLAGDNEMSLAGVDIYITTGTFGYPMPK